MCVLGMLLQQSKTLWKEPDTTMTLQVGEPLTGPVTSDWTTVAPIQLGF